MIPPLLESFFSSLEFGLLPSGIIGQIPDEMIRAPRRMLGYSTFAIRGLYSDTTDYMEVLLDSIRVWLYTPSRVGSGDAGGWISSWGQMVRLEKDHTGWKTGLGMVILFGWIVVLLLMVGWYFTHYHSLDKRTVIIPDSTSSSDSADKVGCTQVTEGGDLPPMRSYPWLAHHPHAEDVLTPNPGSQTPLPPRSAIGIPQPRRTSTPSSTTYPSRINQTRTQIPPMIPPHILLLHYIYPNSSYWPAHYLRAFRLAVESASAHLDSDPERSRTSHTDAPVSANTRTRGKDGKRWNGRVVLSRKRVEEDLRSGEVGLRRGVGGLGEWEGVEWVE